MVRAPEAIQPATAALCFTWLPHGPGDVYMQRLFQRNSIRNFRLLKLASQDNMCSIEVYDWDKKEQYYNFPKEERDSFLAFDISKMD